MAIGLFEKRGINPWLHSEAHAASVCLQHGIAWNGFIAELEDLPIPVPHTEWRKYPIYHLVDFLCANHREFEHGYLPAVQYAKDLEGQGHHGEFLRSITPRWNNFALELWRHMRLEEDILFPHILRNESIQEHPDQEPLFDLGPSQSLEVGSWNKNEHRLSHELDWLKATLDRANSLPQSHSRLVPLLLEFYGKLIHHGHLEHNVLVPWARERERNRIDLCSATGKASGL